MEEGAVLARIESLSEAEFLQTIVAPLLGALGYYDITLEGGPRDSGRDLVCKRLDELGEAILVAVQVKRYVPSARASSPARLRVLVDQLSHALESPIVFPDGTERQPTAMVLVTPARLDLVTVHYIKQQLGASHHRDVGIVDGTRLSELIARHLPSLTSRLSQVESRAVQIEGSKPLAQPSSGILADLPWDDGRRRNRELLDFLSGLRADIDQVLGPSEPIDAALCFVIMSFSSNPVLADFYQKAIKPTIEKLGYRCERVDEQHFNGKITERLFANLRTARLVVADLTEARPNCYYELGIAHALRKEVIHLAYAGEEIHFDIKDWRFIIYSRMDELAAQLRERILGTVGSVEESKANIPARSGGPSSAASSDPSRPLL